MVAPQEWVANSCVATAITATRAKRSLRECAIFMFCRASDLGFACNQQQLRGGKKKLQQMT